MRELKTEEQRSFATSEGLMTPLAANPQLSIIRIGMKAGLRVHRHSHHRDGVVIVTMGKIVFDDGVEREMVANDLAEYSSEEEIGFHAIEDSEALFITMMPQWKSMTELLGLFQRPGE
jgi:quercetin dioxygenase-like cupin family protein